AQNAGDDIAIACRRVDRGPILKRLDHEALAVRVAADLPQGFHRQLARARRVYACVRGGIPRAQGVLEGGVFYAVDIAHQARIIGCGRRNAVDDRVIDGRTGAILDDVVVEPDRTDDAVIPKEALPVVGFLVLDVFEDIPA